MPKTKYLEEARRANEHALIGLELLIVKEQSCARRERLLDVHSLEQETHTILRSCSDDFELHVVETILAQLSADSLRIMRQLTPA